MNSGRCISIILTSVAIFLNITQSVFARSVYVVSDTGTYGYSDSYIRAYKISGSNLIFQTQYQTVSKNAIGLAIDDTDYGDFLFVTFEFSDEIELVNAKAMTYIDTVIASGAIDLAGIAMDKTNKKLYAVDRYTNHLYSWSWNPVEKTLTPDFSFPYYTELQDLEDEYPKGAFGIALDEENGLLYVADNTDSIKYRYK